MKAAASRHFRVVEEIYKLGRPDDVFFWVSCISTLYDLLFLASLLPLLSKNMSIGLLFLLLPLPVFWSNKEKVSVGFLRLPRWERVRHGLKSEVLPRASRARWLGDLSLFFWGFGWSKGASAEKVIGKKMWLSHG